NISTRALLERDLALIKVSADQQNRPHLMELIKVFRARVVDVAPESLIIEVSGTVDKIDGLLEVLRPFGVLEMARSGRFSMTRGGDLLQPPVSEPQAPNSSPLAPTLSDCAGAQTNVTHTRSPPAGVCKITPRHASECSTAWRQAQ